jgi:RNA-directed DNA polymerase
MPALIVDFRRPETLSEVATYLALEPDRLKIVIEAGRTPAQGETLYVRHLIPKRRAGPEQFRTVWDVADSHIRDAHRAFARKFADFVADVLPDFPHAAAYGYVRDRSIKDNADRHKGHKLLLRCDMKDFFPSISASRLINRFVQLGIHRIAAETLAGFATVEGRLALGLNASPMLANLVCHELDVKLDKLAQQHNCTYTRYADDIAVSGDELPPAGAIAQIIEGEGFRVAATKMRVTKLGQAHYVTGLSVSDPSAPHVPRAFKRKLRQELYYCGKFGIRDHLSRIKQDESYQKGINRLDGTVRFVSSIESRHGEQLRRQWQQSLTAESASVSYAPVHDRAGVEATFLIDETQFVRDGKTILAVACVTTEQVGTMRDHANANVRQFLIDPFAPGKKRTLAKKGLHFSEAPENLRDQFIVLLPYLQFRAYVAFAELRADTGYEDLYVRLLGALLPRRFKGFDRSKVSIHVEQNPSVSGARLSQEVSRLYVELVTRNERRPIVEPSVSILSKGDEPAFTLPDSLLWIFARTFGTTEGTDLDYMRFERLRDKYRHIVNLDTGETFSRRHPIEVRARPRTRSAK